MKWLCVHFLKSKWWLWFPAWGIYRHCPSLSERLTGEIYARINAECYLKKIKVVNLMFVYSFHCFSGYISIFKKKCYLSLSSVISDHNSRTNFKVHNDVGIVSISFHFKKGYFVVLKFVSLVFYFLLISNLSVIIM